MKETIQFEVMKDSCFVCDCLGTAFTRDTGQRDLVRRADKVIVIEGCLINCASRMLKNMRSLSQRRS